MSNLLEKSLVMLFSIICLGLSIAYLADKIIPMLKQIFESVAKLLVT